MGKLQNMFKNINPKVSQLALKLSGFNTLFLMIGAFLLQTAIMITFALFWWTDVSAEFRFDSLKEQIVLLVILAPILETLIFQYAIIEMIKSKRGSDGLAVVVSALAFGLTHVYSVQYFTATFFSGLLFALIYLAFQMKNKMPVLFVTILHAAYNLFVVVMRQWNQ
jgi:hypothetical protein